MVPSSSVELYIEVKLIALVCWPVTLRFLVCVSFGHSKQLFYTDKALESHCALPAQPTTTTKKKKTEKIVTIDIVVDQMQS